MTQPTLLALLHPDGFAGTVLVLGSACPPLLSAENSTPPGAQAELILLAPQPAEAQSPAWLRQAAQTVRERLAQDGAAYLLAPPGARLRLLRLLRGTDLRLEASFAHLPNWQASHYLVPFARAPMNFAFNALIPTPRWKKLLVRAWFALPGAARLLGLLWPSAGWVIRRREARPLFNWLRQEGESPDKASVLLRTSWRGRAGAQILYAFPAGGAQPAVIAKASLGSENGPHAKESQALARLAPTAHQAGARVPRALGVRQVGPASALVQTLVSGRTAAEVLRAHPDRLPGLLDELVTWLACWQQSTLRSQTLNPAFLSRALLEPAAELAPLLERGRPYQQWLARRCEQVARAPLPLVAAHNDLTMDNILLDASGRPGIVDWEAAEPDCLPLVDFYYALTDAVMIAHTWGDRLQAFLACFSPGGRYAPMAAALQARLTAANALPPEAAVLSLHACWLLHALNEHHKQAVERPFLSIVDWLSKSVSG